jgi:preprotein translocase subunit SecD
MIKRYPLWKTLLVALVLGTSVVYSLPNLYPPDPAVQISGASSSLEVSRSALERAEQALKEAGISVKGTDFAARSSLLRLDNVEEQLRAKSVVRRALGDDYVVAVNLASTTPAWLSSIGAAPLKLGLDLSGGVHFLLQVDTKAAVQKRIDVYTSDIKKTLRDEKIRGLVRRAPDGRIEASFATPELRGQAIDAIGKTMGILQKELVQRNGQAVVLFGIGEAQIREMEDYAVSQNLTTLRNRVNELGVAEPLIQKQGRNRIVVELPGVQDTAEAKRILGKAANLEFRLEARPDEVASNREEFEFRSPDYGQRSAQLERDLIITGDRVTGASSSFDENGRPQVNINLDSQGGSLMNRETRENIKRRMGVLFIERKTRTIGHQTGPDGFEEPVVESYEESKIISLATIQSALGTQFRITGLGSPAEASELALLLRAGALAAPMDFVEERTVGPSLGAENIRMGFSSLVLGAALVFVSTILLYRVFGLFAVIALSFNVTLLVGAMSALGATLTLPGIAGIVLTIGMAVDANVIINARIREELQKGMSPQAAIAAGYDRAFITILDANLTTLIVGVILYAIGTGPVRGFAVTLSIGILTSMFTSVVITRALAGIVYGGRRVAKISI